MAVVAMRPDRRFAVAQLGARMHYAVPRILAEAGVLERFYTDISIDHGLSALLGRIPKIVDMASFRRLRGRHAEGVPHELVTAFGRIGFEYFVRRRLARSEKSRMTTYLWVADEFSNAVNRYGLGHADSVYGFNGASFGIFSNAKSKGISTILEQTSAPKRIELEILLKTERLAKEQDKWSEHNWERFITREELEWALADTIICASDFVRSGLISCGVPATKCQVVPYGVDLLSFNSIRTTNSSKTIKGAPIKVLFIGSVRTQKGIWLLLDAMRDIRSMPIECRVVGPIAAEKTALERACPDNVQIVGPVPRSDIFKELHQADIFCLPSLCEGSATVIYEALAAGLPIITTENAGSIVRHEKEGLIVNVGDKNDLALALIKLATDTELRNDMARHALERSNYGSLSAYANRLKEALWISRSVDQ